MRTFDMKSKSITFVLGGVILCTTIVISTLFLNSPHSSHATSRLSTATNLQSSSSSLSTNGILSGNVFYGSNGSSVYALNATTGVPIWKYRPSGNAGIKLLGIHNGIVYVSLGGFPGPGYVHFAALEATSGVLHWLSSETIYGMFFFQRVVNGILYLDGNDGGGSAVYALNESNGSLLWDYPAGGPMYGVSVSLVVLSQGVVYTNYTQDSHGFAQIVCALNASDGSQRWCDKNTNAVAFVQGVIYGFFWDPTTNAHAAIALYAGDGSLRWSNSAFSIREVIGKYIYGYSGATICKLNASDGSQLWCVPGNGAIHYSNGTVYVYSTNSANQSSIEALNASDGSLLWTNQDARFVSAHQGVVYAVTSSNDLEALKGSDGALLWQYNLGTRGLSSLSITNGVLYYLSYDQHTLIAFNGSNGSLLWQHVFLGYAGLSAVVNGIAYVSTTTNVNGNTLNHVHAYNAMNGTLLWTH